MKDALILIPSYEPDSLLINTVNELSENEYPILLINDGSSSEYDEIFNQVKDKVKYLSYSKNKGKGYAMKYGYKHIHSLFPDVKYVITVDGDGQHTLKDINRVYEELVKNDELVFGVRTFDKDVPFRSKFGNHFSQVTRSLVTKTYIQDDQCGLRGFPIRYVPELIKISGNRYEYEMNQIIRLQLRQYPLITIPIETVYLDNNSRSHFAPFRDTFRIQTIIFFHSIPALICLALLMMSLIFYTKYNAYPLKISVIFSYTWTFALYFLLMNIFNPSQRFFRRLFKELLFVAIRMSTCYITLEWLSAGIDLSIWGVLLIPVTVLVMESFNVLFAWLFRKMFRTF